MDINFAWVDAETQRRNDVCRFRRVFELAAVPPSAELHLFADSRYRLFVNGTFVTAGPARFVPSHPEYDSVELGPWLSAGENTLLAEVVSYGASTYQTSPASRAGFIAWGEAAEHDFSTPGEWQAQRSAAWDPEAPLFSFAQGPVELRDTRMVETRWQTPKAVDGPWGKLAPRATAYPTFEPAAIRATGTWRLASRERIVGYRWAEPGFDRRTDGRHYSIYAAVLESKQDCLVEAGLFWSGHWLNGQPVECTNDPLRGNRQSASLSLRRGANLLYGEVEQLQDVWGMLLGLPDTVGVSELRCAGLFDEQELQGHQPRVPARIGDLETMNVNWTRQPVAEPALPSRVRAWDLPEGEGSDVLVGPGKQVWCYDAADEFVGYVVVDVEAPSGTILDIGVDDHLRPDGLIALYASNPFANTVDRYLLAGGRQRVQGFHVRGGKHLQITLTLPGAGSARIHDCRVLSANGAFPIEGAFECSDPVISGAWRLSARTLQVSVEDSYADCPWRERGTYLGDSYVNLHLHAYLNTDLRVPRRVLRLFAQSQFADGQMPSAAPSWMTDSLEDYSLIWILFLRDYWQFSGDVDLVRELWPVVERILASSAWREGATGLWTGDGLHLFVDWGVLKSEKQGGANGVLNAFRIAALEAAAELAGLLRHESRAAELAESARLVREAFTRTLWLEAEGRYAPRLEPDGGPTRTCGLHANILALLYRIGSDEQLTRALAYVEERLRENLRIGLEHDPSSGFAEYYFLFFALEALYAHGRAAVAEDLIRTHYGLMLERGATTLWECFSRGARNRGSLCHSWSGAAQAMASRHILGVQMPDPSRPDTLAIRPQTAGLDWARGTVPHARGPIQIEWTRHGDRLDVRVQAPPELGGTRRWQEPCAAR